MPSWKIFSAQLLERRGQAVLPPEGAELITHIQQGARRMQQLISDLLTWSHLAAEEDGGSSVSLNEDLETALTQLQVAIEENKATVTHDPLPTIKANRGQMVRLFQNLVANALKYRKPEEPPVVHVSATRDGAGWWTIAVRDNGIGFDQKYADEIFGVFKRLEPDRSAGTGMGLALCKRIVERHGGRIWAKSAPGRGSEFCFTVPALDG